tara:strand:+ start:405 stop:887 length:483 start_codon:yes stop_codon:yes gene_type:complete
MSERVPRMAPINNQGDGEVETQYTQWPYNSTNMGASKAPTEGQPPNAYPGDEDAEDAIDINIGYVEDFKSSGAKIGIFLPDSKIIAWANDDDTSHFSLYSNLQKKMKRDIDKLEPIRLDRHVNTLYYKPVDYQNLEKRISFKQQFNLEDAVGKYFTLSQY